MVGHIIGNIFKFLHIKTKPEKVLAYLFGSLTIITLLYSLLQLIIFIFGDYGILEEKIHPLGYTLMLFFPVWAYSYYMSSGMPKNLDIKLKMLNRTIMAFCSIMGIMFITYLNSVIWFGLKLLPSYDFVFNNYPELFGPALKTLTLAGPFIMIFKILDYSLATYRDDFIPKAVDSFKGSSATVVDNSHKKFECSNIICTKAETNTKVIVPEKARYQGTLIQGSTGTGKTATMLEPMAARDLEKKFFFRETSKKIGYSLLKRDIAHLTAPYDNEYINKNFTLNFLNPNRGKEEVFLSETKDVTQYVDKETGEMTYRNIGITIVENDGNYIGKMTKVAENFDITVNSIDPLDVENTLSINPFAIKEPAKVASIIADVLKSMYEDQGGGAPGDPFFTQVTLDAFQNLAILLKEMYPIMNNGEIASLEDMLHLLYNFDQVEAMTEEMKKVPELETKYKLLIAYFEKNFYKPSLNINGYEIPGTRGSGRKETERFLYGAITQLNNLLRHPGLKKALCGKDNILDFDKALKEGQMITACSRKGPLGIIQAKAFGMFFIMQFQDAVLRRPGNEDSRVPHFAYIDEFPEYINKDMEVMFTLFRKYRCGIIIAIQNLSQLQKNKNLSYFKHVVLANTKTQVIFGDPTPEDAKYWQDAFSKRKIPFYREGYSFSESGDLSSVPQLSIEKRMRAEDYKIIGLGFRSIFYKTKGDTGNNVYGKGKTNFLDKKYLKKANIDYYNFERFCLNNSDESLIDINSSINFEEEKTVRKEKLNLKPDTKENENLINFKDNQNHEVISNGDYNISEEDIFDIEFEDDLLNNENDKK